MEELRGSSTSRLLFQVNIPVYLNLSNNLGRIKLMPYRQKENCGPSGDQATKAAVHGSSGGSEISDSRGIITTPATVQAGDIQDHAI